MNRCAIYGSGGQGRVVAELAIANGFDDINFFDDRFPELNQMKHWDVCGDFSSLLDTVEQYDIVVVALGDNKLRVKKSELLQKKGAKMPPLIHPMAYVSSSATIGNGTVVFANSTLSAFSQCGNACIINHNVSVDHDSVLSDGVHIAPGAILAGNVRVGKETFVGLGAKILPNLVIGSNAIIGAGATVINCVANNRLVVGTPAIDKKASYKC